MTIQAYSGSPVGLGITPTHQADTLAELQASPQIAGKDAVVLVEDTESICVVTQENENDGYVVTPARDLYRPDIPKVYGPSGPVQAAKIWAGTVTTSASQIDIDISSANFTAVLAVHAHATRNASSTPGATVRAFTTLYGLASSLTSARVLLTIGTNVPGAGLLGGGGGPSLVNNLYSHTVHLLVVGI